MGSSTNAQIGASDLALISEYKKSKDPRFVGELYNRYVHLVIGACMKYLKHQEDAKDASMDIFEELLVKLLVHDISNFKSWLYSLTRNHCLMKIRKVKNITEVDIQDEKIENRFMEKPDFEHLIDESSSETERLQSAVANLKDNQRLCIELFYLKEMSYKQVSEKTGLDLKQVKSNIQNGKRNLQLILSQGINN
jgi:RNA polymerase sigma-70 factor (ECF subfamily)